MLGELCWWWLEAIEDLIGGGECSVSWSVLQRYIQDVLSLRIFHKIFDKGWSFVVDLCEPPVSGHSR